MSNLDDFGVENKNEDSAYEGDEAIMSEEFDGVAIEKPEDFDNPDKQAESIVTDEPIKELAKKPYAEEVDQE